MYFGDKEDQGFASTDPEQKSEIASIGGQSAHEKGTSHEFTPDEARDAGLKGGEVAHEKETTYEWDSNEAREAGRKGGEARVEKTEEDELGNIYDDFD